MNYWNEFAKGIWGKNPVLVLGLGLCPALAISISLSNAFWMAAATAFVLVFSNIVISMMRGAVPERAGSIVFIAIIAVFTTVADLLLHAFQPEAHRALGIFVPLIAVNCIILCRIKESARMSGFIWPALDGLGMGLGFGIALSAISIVREVLGSNRIMGILLIPGFDPPSAMIIAPGAFFTLAFMLWGVNVIKSRKKG